MPTDETTILQMLCSSLYLLNEKMQVEDFDSRLELSKCSVNVMY